MGQLGFAFAAVQVEDRVEVEEETQPRSNPTRTRDRAERLSRLIQKLKDDIGPRLVVQFTQNRRIMVSLRRRRGVTYLRLHELFSHADADVIAALSAYVRGTAPPEQAARIDRFIEAERHRIRELPPTVPRYPKGETHHLGEILDALNAEYFHKEIQSDITWTRANRKKRRKTIRLGSYSDEEKLIRIHPALDQSFVPRYFVEAVVFHEMLHEVHEAIAGPNRHRSVHTPDFLRDEQRFKHYDKAMAWEAKNIRRLLRY